MWVGFPRHSPSRLRKALRELELVLGRSLALGPETQGLSVYRALTWANAFGEGQKCLRTLEVRTVGEEPLAFAVQQRADRVWGKRLVAECGHVVEQGGLGICHAEGHR